MALRGHPSLGVRHTGGHGGPPLQSMRMFRHKLSFLVLLSLLLPASVLPQRERQVQVQQQTPTTQPSPSPSPAASPSMVIAPPPPANTLADLQAKISSILAKPELSSAMVGLKVVSLDTGRVLFEENSGKLMRPASNMKLYTVAAALDRLSPDYRFVTSVYAPSRPDSSGVVRGDLRSMAAAIRRSRRALITATTSKALTISRHELWRPE